MKALKNIYLVISYQFNKLPYLIRAWIFLSLILATLGGYIVLIYTLLKEHPAWAFSIAFFTFTFGGAVAIEVDREK